MVVAVGPLVMKLALGCIGLALGAIDRPAWGQSSAAPVSTDVAPDGKRAELRAFGTF
jgi:hypothetical protein